MSFADNVKKYRVGLGLTQEALGQRVGVSGQAVSKWETADGFPDPSLLPDLADALEVTLDELYGRETASRERAAKTASELLSAARSHEEKDRILFELCADAFGNRVSHCAVTGLSQDSRLSYMIDLNETEGVLLAEGPFHFLSLAQRPEDGWEPLCRDGKTAELLAAVGDPDVLKCVLWLLSRDSGRIEASLIPKKADADVSRTDEILSKLKTIGAVSVETFSVGGIERRIADSCALDCFFKAPMLLLLSAAWTCANGRASRWYHTNQNDPPMKTENA
jgi:transcriptional regulator with XRE-family HTH domain